jgi:PBSX family phage terminase large subunit
MMTMKTNKVKLSQIITDAFKSFWAKSKKSKYLRIVCKGGRGSAKSYHIALKVITNLMVHPVSALVVRKVGNTISDSVFEQLKEAIEVLGVTDEWRVVKSPLQLIYTPVGNKIIFRGADDPAKIKGIKSSKFPVAYLWVEEVAEFKTEDEVMTIEQSVLRAKLPLGIDYKFYYSYNPPKRKQHWLNKKYDSQIIPDNVYVHHSTYLDNPHLTAQAIEDAELLKESNEMKYRWQYLGEPIGSGIVPFDNLVFRTITDEEMNSFDNIRQGLDWGYSIDPFAYVVWHYDKTRRRIYAMYEVYGVQLSNREAAARIKERNYHRYGNILADSSDGKSIDEMKFDHGIQVRKAKKGPGSVEYGEKWLADLEEIVIDARRTPNLAKEFESIDYAVDSDGNPRAKLEDKNNHTIDATRYAFEEDMTRPGVWF